MNTNKDFVNDIKHTFYIGKYLRKSSEEVDSRSIGNQDAILNIEINKIIGNDTEHNYILVDTYIDENYTGTDSDRPDFKRLLKNIASGNINMVMVTDLSRLSRNLSECINYVQSFFVTLDVRFFSKQLPALDSYISPQGIYSMEVPIQSMMNENHCAETSFKVRQTFDALRSAGKFIGAFAGYGWQKDKNDKHHLVLDEEANQVLHMMKDLLLNGGNGGSIARALNEKGFLNPSSYKKANGQNFYCANSSTSLWSSGMVRKLLSRPENIGDLVQGRYKVRSYKIHEQIRTSQDQWFISKSAIPAIFTTDEQNDIMNALMRATRIPPQNKAKDVYLFSGFLKCSDCGKSVVRKASKQGRYVYYMCNTYKNYKGACTKHSISHSKLANAVLLSIQKQIEICVDVKKVVNKLERIPFAKKKGMDFKSTLKLKEKELRNIVKFKRTLYEDWKNKDITHQEYKDMKQVYEEQEIILHNIIDNISMEVQAQKQTHYPEDSTLASFVKYKNIQELTREILLELIDMIIVHENGNITIRFTFADEFKSSVCDE